MGRRANRRVGRPGRRGRRGRRVVLGIVGVVLLAGIVAAAAGWRDLRDARMRLVTARDDLQAAVDDPAALRTPGGRAATRSRIDDATTDIDAARARLRHSVPLALARAVPGVRHQRAGLLQLVDDSRTAARAGRDLLGAADGVASRARLRDGQIPLDDLATLQHEGARAAATLGRLVRSPAGLWGPLGQARRDFDRAAARSARRLGDAAQALGAARDFLGAHGSRRYLLALENNAEMRDQGTILSYAILRVDGGRLYFAHQGRVAEIPLHDPAPTPIPPATKAVFGFIEPTQLWQSVNATADFAWSGRAMRDMYQQATGTPVDGVIGIDVPALAALLRVVGPVSVPVPVPGLAEPISADNVARVLLHDLYDQVARQDQAPRYERLADVAEAVFHRLSTGGHDVVALGRELGDAAAGGHLRLWSADAAEEPVFERTGLGGGPAVRAPDRTFHVAVENRTATKLDYYVQVHVHQRVRVTDLGTAIVQTTVTLDNRAPIDGKPSYQLGPDGFFTKKPGEYWGWVLLWGPSGSTQVGSDAESGLRLNQDVVLAYAGQQRSSTFETIIPRAVRNGRLDLRLVPQPRVSPIDWAIDLDAPGWRLHDPASWSASLDRTRTATWRLGRR